MGEQEQYKNILQKVISDTESSKINSSQELIQMLVKELTGGSGERKDLLNIVK